MNCWISSSGILVSSTCLNPLSRDQSSNTSKVSTIPIPSTLHHLHLQAAALSHLFQFVSLPLQMIKTSRKGAHLRIRVRRQPPFAPLNISADDKSTYNPSMTIHKHWKWCGFEMDIADNWWTTEMRRTKISSYLLRGYSSGDNIHNMYVTSTYISCMAVN